MFRRKYNDTSNTEGRTRVAGAGESVIPSYRQSIALRSMDGNVLRTADTATAWYVLPGQRWSFRGDGDREQLITSIAGQYAELAGRWLHLRVTSRPYRPQQWACAHIRQSRDRPADVAGAWSFDDYMIAEQEKLAAVSMDRKVVYLGVEIRRRGLVDRGLDMARPVLARVAPSALEAELAGMDAELERVDAIVAGAGLEGRPASPGEMRWLLDRSCALGLPAPSTEPAAPDVAWEQEDFAACTDAAAFHQEPYAETVTVTGRTGAVAGYEREVCVLTLGAMAGLRVPEVDPPFLTKAEQVGVPVEWSVRLFVRPPEQVGSEMTHQTNRINAQMRHYTDEHGLDPPQSLDRQAQLASDISDDMETGFTHLATRVKSWWRVALAAPSRHEVLSAAYALREAYKPKIAVEHPEGQYAFAREFIPGEPLASSAYLRRGRVTWAAQSVPQATTSVGDQRGVMLGETVHGRPQPVAWDPWMAQQVRDSSGLTAMVCELGGGKSTLGGTITYKSLRMGARWTLLDPSGPLTKLCELPELRPYARPIDLFNADPGILNPYRVVPEPDWDAFRDEPDPQRAFAREQNLAAATRRRLVLDTLTGLLPHDLGRQPQTKIVLLRAVRTVGGRVDASPQEVIDHLRKDQSENAEHARVVADFLDELKDRLSLLIPDDPAHDPYAGGRDDRLTVLSMAGLVLPKDGISREHWTDQETLGIELLNLAAWLTQRSVYDQPKQMRKGVWIDEAFFLSEVPTGRVLMNRFARDSRKWNVRVLLSSQVPADFTRLEGFASLLDSAFVGQLSDENAQTEALKLLKAPEQVGYEAVLGKLRPKRKRTSTSSDQRDTSPRQFVFSDGDGGVERIRINLSGDHLAHVQHALDTTPGSEGESHTDEQPQRPEIQDHLAEDQQPGDQQDAELGTTQPANRQSLDTNQAAPAPEASPTVDAHGHELAADFAALSAEHDPAAKHDPAAEHAGEAGEFEEAGTEHMAAPAATRAASRNGHDLGRSV